MRGKRDADGQQYSVDESEEDHPAEGHTGCKLAPLPAGLTAGAWNLTIIQMEANRGCAPPPASPPNPRGFDSNLTPIGGDLNPIDPSQTKPT